MRIRVVAYVVRERDGARELLVFVPRGHEHTGLQVPAGRGDGGESVEECLRRELWEEAGISEYRVVRELPVADGGYGSPYEHHAFLVEADGLPDAWEHVVSGDGDDAGFVFAYRWEPLRDGLRLWERREDPVLPGLLDPS